MVTPTFLTWLANFDTRQTCTTANVGTVRTKKTVCNLGAKGNATRTSPTIKFGFKQNRSIHAWYTLFTTEKLASIDDNIRAFLVRAFGKGALWGH